MIRFRLLAGPEHGDQIKVVNAETGEEVPYRSLQVNASVDGPTTFKVEVFAEHSGVASTVKHDAGSGIVPLEVGRRYFIPNPLSNTKNPWADALKSPDQ